LRREVAGDGAVDKVGVRLRAAKQQQAVDRDIQLRVGIFKEWEIQTQGDGGGRAVTGLVNGAAQGIIITKKQNFANVGLALQFFPIVGDIANRIAKVALGRRSLRPGSLDTCCQQADKEKREKGAFHHGLWRQVAQGTNYFTGRGLESKPDIDNGDVQRIVVLIEVQ